MRGTSFILTVALACCSNVLRAEEPNNDFASATVLGPGVLSVTDYLHSFPDTMLGIRDMFGEVYFVDDDGSPRGDGLASGVTGANTNSGSIDFVVSGFPDEFFEGNHGEAGVYEVFVDVYDFFNDPIDSFSEVRTMQPGVVEEFSFSNFEWIGGSYDVSIDNTVGVPDVDFFTFTGLAPGANFTAEVTQETFDEFDSLLGWYDSVGTLLEVDDDDGEETLSLLQGVVPGNGQLTFAVTGYGDDDFLGNHTERAPYALELTVIPNEMGGDFDSDGDIDGRDFLVWQRGGSPSPRSAADLADWQAAYGNGSLAAVSVPEPAALVIVMLGMGAVYLRNRNR